MTGMSFNSPRVTNVDGATVLAFRQEDVLMVDGDRARELFDTIRRVDDNVKEVRHEVSDVSDAVHALDKRQIAVEELLQKYLIEQVKDHESRLRAIDHYVYKTLPTILVVLGLIAGVITAVVRALT